MVYNPVAVLRAKYSTRGLKRQIVGSVVISLFVALFALIAAVLPPAQADGLTPGYWEQTPLPQTGLATFYAPGMMEHVLDVRDGYGQMLRCPECVGTVALLRAGDIGRKVWLQPPDGEKIGPFLVIDCARQVDVWPLVDRNWVVDVSYELGELWDMNRPLDGVTVLADPSDESYSGVIAGPQRAPTPFYVPPGQVVLSAPTPTPAVTPTPWQPTPWPTRLPIGLQPVAPGAAPQQPFASSTPAGPPPPTPLTPIVTTPTAQVTPQRATATPAAPGPANVQPTQPATEVAVGRAGMGLLDPAKAQTPVALPTRIPPAATPSPTPTLVRLIIPVATSAPILSRSGEATPTPKPGDENGVIDALRALFERLRP